MTEPSTCGHEKYTWPDSTVGVTQQLPCPCNNSRTAYKQCVLKPGRIIAQYDYTNMTACEYRNEDLKIIAEVCLISFIDDASISSSYIFCDEKLKGLQIRSAILHHHIKGIIYKPRKPSNLVLVTKDIVDNIADI